MKRWNGWGDDSIEYPLPPAAEALIRAQIGPGRAQNELQLADVAVWVPQTRLPPHPLISFDSIERVCHARGQSLPDLIALRTGCGLAFPDGVAYPTCEEEVRDLLIFAKEAGIQLIPYGGGTSVVGHINVLPGNAPVLT